jgi:hypothetical protein
VLIIENPYYENLTGALFFFSDRQCWCDEYPIYHHCRWIRGSMSNGKEGKGIHMLASYRKLIPRSLLYSAMTL